MRGIIFAVLYLCASSTPCLAIVGGAPPAGEVGRSVVLLLGSRGTSCSGVALARNLVLTAAHCVLPGADYKLAEFDDAHRPTLKPVGEIARHPEFDVGAVLRHRVTADVALIWPSSPLAQAPAVLAPEGSATIAGDRFVIAGYGLSVAGDGRSGGTVRSAALVATGQPGSLQLRLVDPATMDKRAGLGACTGDSGAPVFRESNSRLLLVGLVSWSTGPQLSEGCGGLTGVTPLGRYRQWIADQARRKGSAILP